jgi:hypothetical protein
MCSKKTVIYSKQLLTKKYLEPLQLEVTIWHLKFSKTS